jgi:serine/threonine-protein kinase
VQDAPEPIRSINPDVPADFEAIVHKLLAKKPGDRYASAEDLRADLRRFRQGEPVLAAQDVGAATVGMAAVAATQAVATSPAGATTAIPAATPATTTTDEVSDYYAPKRGGWFVVLVIVLLAALGGLIWLLFRTVFNDDDETATLVEVPSVVNLTVDEATSTLRELGFEVTPRAEQNDQVAEGTVFAQDPAAGTQLEEGETVTITVSSGATTNTLPEVTGLSADEARQQLAAACFTNVTDTQQPSDDVAPGTVISMSPAANTEVACATGLSLVVSAGQRTIPDVTGRTVAEATNILGQSGYTYAGSTDEASATVPNGRVIRSDPPQGTSAPQGTGVTLVVSTGPPTTAVPDVVDDNENDARQALTAAGFQVAIDPTCVQPRGTQANGVVDAQNPAANAQAAPGATVTHTMTCPSNP